MIRSIFIIACLAAPPMLFAQENLNTIKQMYNPVYNDNALSNNFVTSEIEQYQNQSNNIATDIQGQSIQVYEVSNLTYNHDPQSNIQMSQVKPEQAGNNDVVKDSRDFWIDKIELPSPKSIRIDNNRAGTLKESGKKQLNSDIDTVNKKASGGRLIYIEKGFWKKNISNPLKGWFKRNFSKTKKVKVRLTCFF